jgi:serine phosphatase RsbU (regulator of sigma subunit)
VTSARLSDLALVAYRNARRSGKDLGAQAGFVHETLARGFDREGFVTGQMLWVDLDRPGQSHIVNAGHPPPYVHRGRNGPETLELHIDYPFGMPFDNRLRTQELELRSGDRLVLYSDGVVEARPDGGEVFGEERLARELVEVRDFPPREAARRIIGAVRRHRAADLTDDATLLMVDIR